MSPLPVTAVDRTDADAARAAVAEPAHKGAQLPRELADFLMDLAVAMHKHAIYPRGHPLLDQAVDSVHLGLTRLLADRPALSIGVARRELIIEGVATDSNHPLLAELAGKLHRHHLGAVKMLPGITRAELSDALATVGLEVQRSEMPIGMRPELLQSRWTSVKLFPLTYDRLELVDEGDSPTESASAGMRGGHAAQLWAGLARAAIASDLAAQPEQAALEPEAVAQAIDEHDREQAYDQVIVGYLLQIAREVRQDGTREDGGLQRRISRLVGSLQPSTLQRLLQMGGDAAQRRRFVLDASQGMTLDAVVGLVQAAATAEGQTISHSLVRMLTKLASHAEHDAGARGRAADGAFRENVERLIGSWSLDDPNPVAYSAALSQIAQANAPAALDASGTSSLACEPARIVAMALELDAMGQRVTHAIDTMLEAGALAELLDQLDAAPDPAGPVAAHVWARIRACDPLPTLLAAPRLEHALIRRLVARTGASATPAILAALGAGHDATRHEATRHDRLLGYLVLIGTAAASDVAAHLAQATAPLARELLATLAKLAPAEPPVEAGPYLNHFDPTLRREAAKLLLAYEATREETVLAAVRDPDERVAYCAILAAASACPPEAAAIIRQRIDGDELTDAAVRAAGIRAAATQRDDATLEWILRRALVPGRLLRRPRLAPASPEVLASLTALATYWADDPRATPALELAHRSASPSVRSAVQQRDASAAEPAR